MFVRVCLGEPRRAETEVLSGTESVARKGVEVAMQTELEALKKRLYVDNAVKNIKFFPGTNVDSTPEDMARELNKFFAETESAGFAEESSDS